MHKTQLFAAHDSSYLQYFAEQYEESRSLRLIPLSKLVF